MNTKEELQSKIEKLIHKNLDWEADTIHVNETHHWSIKILAEEIAQALTTKPEEGIDLFKDLGHRLIGRILKFNPDEHDIELNLCGIIEKAKQWKPQEKAQEECDHDNVRIANHWECRKCGKITKSFRSEERVAMLEDYFFHSNDDKGQVLWNKVRELITVVNQLMRTND